MKHIFKALFAACILTGFSPAISAQLTEQIISKEKWQPYGKVKNIGVAKASLEYKANASDSTFILLLEDDRKELKNFYSVGFNSRGNTLNSLYEMLISFFEKENWNNEDYVKIFTLGDTKVSVYKATGLMPVKAIIFSTDKGRTRLSKSEIKQLFNR